MTRSGHVQSSQKIGRKSFQDEFRAPGLQSAADSVSFFTKMALGHQSLNSGKDLGIRISFWPFPPSFYFEAGVFIASTEVFILFARVGRYPSFRMISNILTHLLRYRRDTACQRAHDSPLQSESPRSTPRNQTTAPTS